MLLHEGGSINLLHSTFQANFGISEFPADVMNVSFVNGTDSVGIVNLGGEVHCDILGCLPVCTSCLSLPPPPTTTDSCCEARQVSPPTSQPIVAIQPAVAETGSKHRLEKNNVITGLEIGSSIALLIFGVAMAVLRRRRARCCFWLKAGEDRTSSNQQPFFDPGDGDGESVELVGRSMMKTHETSPGARAGFFCNNATFRTVTTITIPRSPPPPPSAPVFVVGRNSMRITLWSPGMEIAVPTHGSPVGGLLSDLPFVNGDDGYRLHRSLGHIFDAPTEHDPARTFVLHFLAQTGQGAVIIDSVGIVLGREPDALQPVRVRILNCKSLLICTQQRRNAVHPRERIVRRRASPSLFALLLIQMTIAMHPVVRPVAAHAELVEVGDSDRDRAALL